MSTKKGNPLLSVRIPPDLNQMIEARMKETEESKSDVAIAALTHYLQPPNPEDELAQLKRRVQRVEQQLAHMQEVTP
jgi:hypothetical protein